MGTWCKLRKQIWFISRWGFRRHLWDMAQHLYMGTQENFLVLTHSMWVVHRYPSATVVVTAYQQPKAILFCFALLCVFVYARVCICTCVSVLALFMKIAWKFYCVGSSLLYKVKWQNYGSIVVKPLLQSGYSIFEHTFICPPATICHKHYSITYLSMPY